MRHHHCRRHHHHQHHQHDVDHDHISRTVSRSSSTNGRKAAPHAAAPAAERTGAAWVEGEERARAEGASGVEV
eukprot:3350931-Rhodomonas_salina.1